MTDEMMKEVSRHFDGRRHGGVKPCTWPVVNPDTGAFCCLTHGLAPQMVGALERIAAAADVILDEHYDTYQAAPRWNKPGLTAGENEVLSAGDFARALLARLAGREEATG